MGRVVLFGLMLDCPVRGLWVESVFGLELRVFLWFGDCELETHLFSLISFQGLFKFLYFFLQLDIFFKQFIVFSLNLS